MEILDLSASADGTLLWSDSRRAHMNHIILVTLLGREKIELFFL